MISSNWGYPKVKALAGDKEICQVVRRLMSIALHFPHPQPFTARLVKVAFPSDSGDPGAAVRVGFGA
jgi:hypothetical protein